MRIPRLYLPVPLVTGESVPLTDSVFRHAVQVLRLRSGADIVLFNGEGGEFQARLEKVERRQATARINDFIERDVESSLSITLVQSISKGERMDYTLQKAVELGVKRIVPVVSRYSAISRQDERLQKRRDHWRAVVISACEQCGRTFIPVVTEPLDLPVWLNDFSAKGLNILLNPLAELHLKTLAPASDKQVRLLIGPEGGLSREEITLAEQAGFTGVRLGPRVLRTETAGVAALAALQLLWGDFGAPDKA